jgi:polysaccharide biosynthesis transport protein
LSELTLTDLAPPPDPKTEEVGVGKSSLLPDPRIFLVIFWRRMWIFVALFTVILGAAVAYATLTPRTYSATSTILIEPRRADPVQPQETAPADQSRSSDFIDTQIVVLDSPQIAEGVVSALRLTEDAQFGPGIVDTSGAGLTPAQERARLTATAQALRGAVTMRRAGQTSLIEITASTRSPTQAARIANEYVRQYLASIEAAKASSAQVANTKIDSRLDELRKAAEAADADLQRYKIANGLMSAAGATLVEQEASTLNQQLAQARAALAERQGRLAAARKQLSQGGGGGDVASALNSGTIGSLRAQEADSSRNLAQLRTRYGPRHPAVAQEEQRLADVQRQIQLEIDRIMSSLQAEVNVAASGLASLESSQAGSKSRLAGNASAQVGFLERERKANAARIVYEAFLNRSRGAAARDGIEPPIASMSSAAVVPLAPSAPNVLLIYLLGLVFATTSGLIGVAVAEFLDSGVKTKTDVERRLGARYMGAIPEIESTLDGLRLTEPPHDYIVSHPLSTFAESMRNLRASITLRGNRQPRVIALTSALPREGKTTTAVCLARTIAMSGATTILLDCDIRRHSASDLLLGEREGRLIDYLTGKVDIDAAILLDTDTPLSVLGATTTAEDGRDLLSPAAVKKMLAELRERFEFIVIDTAPVLGIADARTVASQADAVLLLARWRSTSLRAVDAALDLLLGAQAKVYGVALTLVNLAKFGSAGPEDAYGYHKKFKGYYVN